MLIMTGSLWISLHRHLCVFPAFSCAPLPPAAELNFFIHSDLISLRVCPVRWLGIPLDSPLQDDANHRPRNQDCRSGSFGGQERRARHSATGHVSPLDRLRWRLQRRSFSGRLSSQCTAPTHSASHLAAVALVQDRHQHWQRCGGFGVVGHDAKTA